MPRRAKATVFQEGRHYRLGYTDQYCGIWRKRPWGWRLASRYPLTEDGWRVANQQFAILEPDQQIPNGERRAAESTADRRWGRSWWGAAALAGILVVAGGVYLAVRPSSSLNSGSGTSQPAVGT